MRLTRLGHAAVFGAAASCASLIDLEHARFVDLDAGDASDATATDDASPQEAAVDAGAESDVLPIAVDASLDGADPDGCPGDVFCHRVVFVTAATFGVGAPLTGDSLCTAAAATSILPRIKGRRFRAWTSTSDATDPESRFVRATAPYVRADGTVIAVDWADLTDGTLSAGGIQHDENGNVVNTLSPGVWTGTEANGFAATPNCASWSDGSATGNAVIGVAGFANFAWSNAVGASGSCAGEYRLYCFEE